MIPIGIGDDELVQREVDGDNAAEESIRLRERLAAEPELNKRFELLQHTVHAVGRLTWFEAPESLARDVMRDLHRRTAPPRHRGLAGLGRALFARPVLAYGSALAAGVLLGAVLFGAGDLSRQPGSDASLTGAALPGATIAQPPVSHVLRLAEGPLRARVLWRPTAQGVRVEFALEAPGPIDGTLHFNSAAFQPRAVELADNAEGEAVLASGRVELRQVREGAYAVVLESSQPTREEAVSVRIESEGQVVEGQIGPHPRGDTEG